MITHLSLVLPCTHNRSRNVYFTQMGYVYKEENKSVRCKVCCKFGEEAGLKPDSSIDKIKDEVHNDPLCCPHFNLLLGGSTEEMDIQISLLQIPFPIHSSSTTGSRKRDSSDNVLHG